MSIVRYNLVTLILTLILFFSVGCDDTSELEDKVRNLTERIDNIESAIQYFQTSFDAGRLIKSVDQDEHGWTVTFSDDTSISSSVISSITKDDGADIITITIADGTVFYFKVDPSLSINKECDIRTFKLLLKDNPEVLLSDITATVNGQYIDILIPYICDVSRVIPFIELVNENSEIEEMGLLQGIDLTKKQVMTISNQDGNRKEYVIRTRVFTGLPIVRIETENRYVSPDKNEYVNGTIDISKTNEFPTGFSSGIKLKGRGNATWIAYPKKPYRIKLDDKASVFDMASDKS